MNEEREFAVKTTFYLIYRVTLNIEEQGTRKGL